MDLDSGLYFDIEQYMFLYHQHDITGSFSVLHRVERSDALESVFHDKSFGCVECFV